MKSETQSIVLGNSIFTAEEIRRFRQDTEGCHHVIHLNNAGAGLMPNVVTQAQIEHLKLESPDRWL